MALRESFTASVEVLKREYQDLIIQELSSFRSKAASTRRAMSGYSTLGLARITKEKSLEFVRRAADECGQLQDLTSNNELEEAHKIIVAAAHELLAIGSVRSPVIHASLYKKAGVIRESAARELEEETRNRLLVARDKHNMIKPSVTPWVLLFLQAYPDGQVPIKSNCEYRDIEGAVRGATHRDQIKPVMESATRVRDVIRAVNEHRPQVIHFSGHGDHTCLALLDDDDRAKEFDGKHLANLILASNDSVELVVFNSCHSLTQAEKLLEAVPHVIGTTGNLPDAAALIFSPAFYGALAYGRSILAAFSQAQIFLANEVSPAAAAVYELRSRPHCDANKAFLATPNAVWAGDEKDRPLSQEEQALLRSTGKTGNIQIIETDQAGQWVRAGTTDLQAADDPSVAARSLDALYSLEKRGLVRHVKGILYTLTGKGFTIKEEIR